MCGISGILSFKNKIQQHQIKQMTDAIAHRGPDGEGQWINSNELLGLGHRRLSILDLSDAAGQPMRSACGNYTIVFNGEIYNYIELKEELLKKGEHFITNSDTEVLLKLFTLYREKCLDVLDGMWAFAIWDEEKQELFCARDRFGEKPFHYFMDETGFYFASEMKSLWEIGIPRVKDDYMWEIYQNTNRLFDSNDLNRTFYKNIKRLEHSHYLTIDSNKQIKLKKYYDIDYKSQSYKGTFEEATLEFKSLFIESLKRRFRADVPIGSSLSGGLDSSSIVCNMKAFINSENITPKTFSARFKDFAKDEGYFIEKVIDKTGFKAHYVWPTGEEMNNDFEKLCYHQEEPFGSASIYAQYRVQQLAKEHNVTVLIDGQGADEILAGYLYYFTIYLNDLAKTRKSNLLRLIKEQHRLIDFHTPHSKTKKTFLKLSNFYFWRSLLKRKKNSLNLNEALYESTMKGGLQELLRYADRNSMTHSREVRLPFLSKDLVEFCFSLPDDYKLKLGWTKYVMRNAFNDVLPKEICWRKEKIGFEPPQEKWISSFGKNINWKELMKKSF